LFVTCSYSFSLTGSQRRPVMTTRLTPLKMPKSD